MQLKSQLTVLLLAVLLPLALAQTSGSEKAAPPSSGQESSKPDSSNADSSKPVSTKADASKTEA
jgi:hypothetical protein